MATISIILPDQLKKSVEELAKLVNLSTDEFISMTLSEKVTQVDQLKYLQMRAVRGSHEALLTLKKAPDVAADAGDELN